MPTVTLTESGLHTLSISFCSDSSKVKQQNKYLRIPMKELINVAEKLYKQIDNAQVHLINARLQKDDEGKKSAISEMETAMCDASRLLKCLIERKDNIVDLGEVWHDIKEEPEYGNPIVIAYITKQNNIGTLKRASENRFTWYIEKYAIYKWAYLKDLLPKGGDI